MKLKTLALFVILITFYSSAQTKYFIYFKDKGIDQNQTLSKHSVEFQNALSNLSHKSIERRKKTLDEDQLITFEDLPLKDEYVREIISRGVKIENKLKWFNSVTAYLNDEEKTMVEKFSFVEKVIPVRTLVFKNDFTQTDQQLNKPTEEQDLSYGNSFTQLDLSGIPQVHSKGITGEGVIIGLLDTGFNWHEHEALINTDVLAEYDFIFKDSITANESEDNLSQHGHGTYVLSIVGGFKDGALIGASFGSEFVLAKTEDIRSETHVEEDNYAAALEWMDSIGVDVVSSSLGYSEFDATDFSYSYSDMNGNTTIVSQAVNLAFERGIVTITSAGNEGSSPWFYITSPADAFDVISVGAVTSNNNVDTYSSRGPTFDGRIKPEVVAMGTSVWGVIASQFSGYASNSGTSAAAPIVAGVAGLILSAYPHLSNIQVRNILMETSDNAASPDNERGYGLVSAVNAISFPNLQRITNSFILNKIFFNNTSIVPGSVKVNFIGKVGQSNSLPMGFDNLYKYNVEVPAYFDNELVQFYFSFTDSLGNTIREPSNTNYKFSYGDLEIALNLSLPAFAGDYIISDLYPNPYIPSDHNTVRFNYKSAGNEKLKLMIIDAAGQKVKSFETVTAEGENFMEWNGYSDNGYLCASGVYYFLVELNGRQFGRKLILLK